MTPRDIFSFTISPNNIAITLDNAEASMLSIHKTTPRSVAVTAQYLSPVSSNPNQG